MLYGRSSTLIHSACKWNRKGYRQVRTSTCVFAA